MAPQLIAWDVTITDNDTSTWLVIFKSFDIGFVHGDIHDPLQWRHNGLYGVSNHQPHHCLLSRLFGRRSASLAFVRHRSSWTYRIARKKKCICKRYFSSTMIWTPVTSVSWWRHQVEAFSALLALCAGNLPVTCEFPLKANDAKLWCFLWRRCA